MVSNCAVDIGNPTVISLIKEQVIYLDVEFMDVEDIQALVDAGVDTYTDLNGGEDCSMVQMLGEFE